MGYIIYMIFYILYTKYVNLWYTLNIFILHKNYKYMYKYNAFLNKIFTLRSNLDVKNMKNPNNNFVVY